MTFRLRTSFFLVCTLLVFVGTGKAFASSYDITFAFEGTVEGSGSFGGDDDPLSSASEIYGSYTFDKNTEGNGFYFDPYTAVKINAGSNTWRLSKDRYGNAMGFMPNIIVIVDDPTHGDFYEAQIITSGPRINGSKLGVFDLDLSNSKLLRSNRLEIPPKLSLVPDGSARWSWSFGDFDSPNNSFSYGEITSLRRVATTPNAPAPTSTPSIDAFPEPKNFYSELVDFGKNQVDKFSDVSSAFLDNKFIELDNWLGQSQEVKDWFSNAATVVDWALLGVTTYGDWKAILKPTTTIEKAIAIWAQRHIVSIQCNYNECGEGGALLLDITQESINYATENGLDWDPVSALISLNSLIWKYGVLTELEKLANDPPNPAYMSVYEPDLLGSIELPLYGIGDLDDELMHLFYTQQEMYWYLKSVNISFDRYTTAYQDGEAIYAGLQLEAILGYLSLYNDSLIEMDNSLNGLADSLTFYGLDNATVDQDFIDATMDELVTNGLPEDLSSYILGLGLTETDVRMITQNIYTDLGNLESYYSVDSIRGLGSAYRGASTLGVPQERQVPEPKIIWLLIIGFAIFIISRRKLIV